MIRKISLVAVFLLLAASLVSCGKTTKLSAGTWVYNTPENGTSTLVVKKADEKSFTFYIESERKEVYRIMEGTAVRADKMWVFDLEKEDAREKSALQSAAAGSERKGAYYEKGGFKIRFVVKESKGKIDTVVVTGDNDGAFFQGNYTFLNSSVENPKPAVKVIDGYYRKAGDPLVLDVYLNSGKIAERKLSNGEIIGGRDLGTFSFFGPEMIVSSADAATGATKMEHWIVVDDNTLKDPLGTEYTYYVP